MSSLHGNAEQGEEDHPILSKKLAASHLSESSYSIMSWNVWSILNSEKLDSFLQVLEDNGIHIACITETWFDSRNGKFTSTIKNAGYDIVHSYREKKRWWNNNNI